MLARRLASLPPSSSTTARAFTSSAVQQRAPSLADITPKGASEFDARQKEFREGLRSAQKAKEAQDSQSAAKSKSTSGAGSASTAQDASNAGSTTQAISNMALGSLSTHNTESAREQDSKEETTKRKGALSSLIYGTHEGQKMDQDIEKSFSQVLARGKYMHSIVFHTVKPDKVDEYTELVGNWYPRVAKREENHVHLVGSWRTEVGDCDTFGRTFNPWGCHQN